MTQITLPPLCVQGLRELYAAQQQATLLYETAMNSALTAVGLDHRQNHELNLDVGIITVAEPPKEQDL
jgi:hypothetical protein